MEPATYAAKNPILYRPPGVAVTTRRSSPRRGAGPGKTAKVGTKRSALRVRAVRRPPFALEPSYIT
eukprot:2967680-Prymnesium_polylepis.2